MSLFVIVGGGQSVIISMGKSLTCVENRLGAGFNRNIDVCKTRRGLVNLGKDKQKRLTFPGFPSLGKLMNDSFSQGSQCLKIAPAGTDEKKKESPLCL